MDDASATLKHLNRTLIGSVLFIDIVNYSMSTVPDQLAMKEAFIDLLVEAIQNVAPADRIMVDTGDGAGIAFIGDPEDALFTALSLRDAIESGQVKVGEPGFVRMGINLGPLKVVRDINGHTNMIGDAVNDAQRVMSFAEPGQVMVSHSYYDIISRFSRDYSKLFVHEGMRHDKHVREHQIYRFGPVAETENLAEKLRDRSRARTGNTGTFAWQEDDPPASAAKMAATATAPAAPASSPPKSAPPQAASRRTLSRNGLIAGIACLALAVGALWSWSGTGSTTGAVTGSGASAAAVKPDAPPEVQVAAASVPSPVQAAPATAPATTAQSASANVPAGATIASENNVASAPAASVPVPAAASVPNEAKHADTPAAPVVQAAKPGTLKLVIRPWGEVYVDGSKRGISPPISSLSLAPGKHRIEIRNSQFASQKQVVEVRSGVETTMNTSF
ncbi:MAG TPA: adenylate/guanylate cyclase domain-containing protein [Burkholderiaceae bacterium]|jgi:class 3 adenylate cyclase